jgi:hypothetical protein
MGFKKKSQTLCKILLGNTDNLKVFEQVLTRLKALRISMTTWIAFVLNRNPNHKITKKLSFVSLQFFPSPLLLVKVKITRKV